MDDSEVIDMATEVFVRNAITQAADNVLCSLQRMLNIKDSGHNPGTAIHFQEHLNDLVKDYCDIFNDLRMNSRI